MSRNFVILFEEKEGSTPLVQTLDHLPQIDVLHQDDPQGWEPFDPHNGGAMPLRGFLRCLELAFGDDGVDRVERLNAEYGKTARMPLVPFDPARSVGCKMRFRPQRPGRGWLGRKLQVVRFERASTAAFRRLRVVVFVTVRQDVLRWALSKYHGDGSGRPGHLQFKLAAGQLDRAEIPRIEVDLDRLGDVIEQCDRSLAAKRSLVTRLRRRGVAAHPLMYEEFCGDRPAFLRALTAKLELHPSDEEIATAIAAGTGLQKVHGEDIAEFVTNAGAVIARFGGRFFRWDP